MGKALIIAEKPSVAADLAKVLGKFKKEKDFFENDEYIISSAVGHLLELHADSCEPKGKWKIKNLPVIPDEFELRPIKKSEERLKVLQRLIKRKEVDLLINACDAGREGELIFYYIIKHASARQPVKRLWLQSMTPSSIREGFKVLKDGEELRPLADAAVSRSEADWLIGINGTRALTDFNSPSGGFNKTTVGRVQTPTLTIMVRREEIIQGHKARPYWELHGRFAAVAGEYPGRWFDETFKRTASEENRASAESENRDEKPERIWDEKMARRIAQACEGQSGVVEEKSKPTTQMSPLLFDLTSLQREANSRFGISARNTLGLAQALYEKHKVLTYPRTDSRCLPEDYVKTVFSTVASLKSTHLAPHASKILDEGWIKPSKRIFNNAKVSDHFAIIPTGEISHKLSEAEQKIYDLVSKRFLAVFFPPAVFEVTTRITRVVDHAFKTEGKVLKEAGWLAIYGKEEQNDDDQESLRLVSVTEGEKVHTEEVEVRELITKPPARFSEATLLSAMEGAGKWVDDEELRDAMSERGLGTPATRAAIIEGLIKEEYIERLGRELKPTAKAFHLLETLKILKVDALSLPEMTGEWEYKLKLIEQKKMSREAFMREIQDTTRDLVERVRLGSDPSEVKLGETGIRFDGRIMIQTLKDFRTNEGDFAVPRILAGRTMTEEEVSALVSQRRIGPLDGFRNRLGRTFSAHVTLNESNEVALDWGQNEVQDDGESQFAQLEPLGIHPHFNVPVYELPNSYRTKEKDAEGKRPLFSMSRTLLQQEISPEQVVKLLTAGKTDLMTGFVSKKSRRPFKAFLFLKDDGNTGFEFPPRAAKPPAKKKRTR
ncbi:MAG: DNA topoisomerase III [Candidatus Methylacidiphilales bacterium]